MGKVKLGATLADARNAVGGIVYSKNQFGAYIRQKVSPVQPRSEVQTKARAQVQHLATYWANTLTAAQRQAWISLAQANPVIDVFGDSQILTGLQFFVRVNRNLMKLGEALIPNAPPDQDVTALLSLSLLADVSDAKVQLTFTPTPLAAGEALVVYMTCLLPQGRAFAQNFLKLVSASTATVSPVNIYGDWVSRYGTLVAGPKLIVEASILDKTNGAQSAVLQASCTVSA